MDPSSVIHRTVRRTSTATECGTEPPTSRSEGRNRAHLVAVDHPPAARGVGVAGGASDGQAVLVVLADNQRPAAEALGARGAALVLDVADAGFDPGLDAAVDQLMSNDALRHRMSASSAALCDGLGAGRVADAVLTFIAEGHP